jgi:hypothetical protein
VTTEPDDLPTPDEPDDDEAFKFELGPNNCAASQESLAGD